MRKLLVLVLIMSSLVFTACSSDSDAATAMWEDGTYTGAAKGYAGEIEVEVKVTGGEIVEVNILNHNDTPGISDGAFKDTPGAIIEAQSADIDALTGATASSQGIVDAAKAALEQAKK
ncbi:FMN-binding protein [Alkalicella caledoniensis]|uniref:FMN-binding protein n=1 Tax=Alkalicella caledoniensis TaxID=2731377 RepID=A0A7G9W5J5_ALKCA|nr:FMN-binding protein [Alkalicella caledoniensis]QNO13957.1 FMN-binding protein [Alkalicella caledoniensis]